MLARRYLPQISWQKEQFFPNHGMFYQGMFFSSESENLRNFSQMCKFFVTSLNLVLVSLKKFNMSSQSAFWQLLHFTWFSIIFHVPNIKISQSSLRLQEHLQLFRSRYTSHDKLYNFSSGKNQHSIRNIL